MKLKPTKNLSTAKKLAKKFATEGPRVSAVLRFDDGKFTAVPGFLDADTDTVSQIILVTPDGRYWVNNDAGQ